MTNIVGVMNNDFQGWIGRVYGTLNGNVFNGGILQGIERSGIINGNVNGSIYGDVDGIINGNIFGNIHGNVTGKIKGNVEGIINGRVTGIITGLVSNTPSLNLRYSESTHNQAANIGSAIPVLNNNYNQSIQRPQINQTANVAITNKQQINNMASSTKEKSIIQGRVEKNYKENASTNIPIRLPNKFNIADYSSICVNKSQAAHTTAPYRSPIEDAPYNVSLHIGDIFLANLWDMTNPARIEEALLKLSQEGDFYTIEELQSSLDALNGLYLPRTSELKAKIYALISKANLTHQTNPVRNAAPIKAEPTIASRVIEPSKNTSTPQIQRHPSVLIIEELLRNTGEPQTQKPITPNPIAPNLANKSLHDKENLNILKTTNTAKSQSNTISSTISCTICLESFDEIKDKKKTIMSTFCGHVFCSGCVDALFLKKKVGVECPSCRKKITKSKVHTLFI